VGVLEVWHLVVEILAVEVVVLEVTEHLLEHLAAEQMPKVRFL
jgi:hypothetical protein